MELNQEMPATELQLGDHVKVSGGYAPWDTAIVCQIDDTLVHLFRPYGTTAGFHYTGRVVCYVGIETFSRPRVPREIFFVYRRELVGSPLMRLTSTK